MSTTASISSPALGDIFGSSDTTGTSWDRVVDDCLYPVFRYYVPMLLACYGLTVFLAKQLTDWKGLKLQKLAGSLSMYPAFFVLVATSHLTLMDSQFWTWDYNNRMRQTSVACDVFCNFYIAANIVQALGQIQTEKPPLLYQLMAHHVLSVAAYMSSFYFDRYRWWTALAGSCEITNLFLVPVFACKEFFPEWKKQTWYMWNTRLLWITFVTHRLVLFPCWLGLWFYDRWQSAINGDKIHWVEGTAYPGIIFGLLILSMVWFAMIDRGLKKQSIAYKEAQGKKL